MPNICIRFTPLMKCFAVMNRVTFQIFCSFLFFQLSFGQAPEKWNASKIEQAIQKLGVLGNVLYVAAHPDDENTRLITYFSNYHLTTTAYISLTRGSGGQNLIGKELKEPLGVIRTHELMEARKIDGGEQFFSRAKDFGYSKNPAETFEKWNKNEVLYDLVLAIRKFRPDIIINRFDHRTEGNTHGHHTASAILSVEAFDLAGDVSAFPEQLTEVDIWQPKAIYFNDSWFFYGSPKSFEEANHNHFLAVPIGKFYPTFGLSNNEIAALSRSQHKSQGFGNTGSRGDETEYIEFIKGDHQPQQEVFEAIDISWNRISNTKKIQKQVKELQNSYSIQEPWNSIPQLARLHQLIATVEDEFWRTKKQEEVEAIIQQSAGLFIEARTNQSYAYPGEKISIQVEAINQSKLAFRLEKLQYKGKSLLENELQLSENQRKNFTFDIEIPASTSYSTPFWLQKEASESMYSVEEEGLENKATNPMEHFIEATIAVEGISFDIQREIVFKTNDPVDGEVYKKLHIVPEISLQTEKEVLIFNKNSTQQVHINIESYTTNANLKLATKPLEDWDIQYTTEPILLSNRGATSQVNLSIRPKQGAKKSLLQPSLVSNANQVFITSVTKVDYPHIDNFVITKPFQLELVPLNIQISTKKVAYLQGAGDLVDEATSTLGFDIKEFKINELNNLDLSNFDVMVIGIRAFNVHDELAYLNEKLFKFVEEGGHLVIQYQTSGGLKTKKLSPLELQLNRGRVTDENAKVSIQLPEHSFVTYPNTINSADFEFWTQERGLYFASQWGTSFEAILGMNDSGEAKQLGSLLTAKYGKGQITYTGLSFFRQLPAGVEGAYKLWANILSLETEK